MSNKPDIRLVAIDLDGTLLTDSKQVHVRTVKAIKQLSARGLKVVIASARPPRSVRHIYEALGLNTLQINYNGALIWDPSDGIPIFHLPMEPGLVRRIIEDARGRCDGVLVTCEIMDKWYTDRIDNSYTTETGRMFKPDVIAPLDSFLNQPITKLLLLGEHKLVLHLEAELADRYCDQVSLVRTDENLLQFMHRRVSKAAALQQVAERYGISMSQVMAIGDAPNDYGMLQLAGVAVAMDNADPRLKAEADWIAPSNNDHGVLAAFQHFGLLG